MLAQPVKGAKRESNIVTELAGGRGPTDWAVLLFYASQ